MYENLKAVVKKVLPKKFLFENEDFFRKFLVPFYSGKKHQCNICKTNLRNFAILNDGALICPICGSLPRTRRLYAILQNDFLKPDISMLDFSPFRMIYRKLRQRKDFSYFPTDFGDNFLSDYQFDITKIDSEDNKFDLIVCYHILEHIVEDKLAMKELHRVLKIGGTALVQTPFKEGEIYENYTITTPEQRLEHFGQDDHVRVYSVSGLEKRLNEAGFETEVQTFGKDNFFGLNEGEKIIFCRKNSV